MTDIVLNGQLSYSQKFYLPSVNSGKLIDEFTPSLPYVALPGMWRKTRVSPIGAFSNGGLNTFQIPPRGTMISDMYLELNLGAPSNGKHYCQMPAAGAIQRIVISHGGNELHNYDYQLAFGSVWAKISREYKNMLAVVNGALPGSKGADTITSTGYTPAVGALTCYAPVFAFWTNFTNEHPPQFSDTLPLLASSTPLNIDVYLNTVEYLIFDGSTQTINGTPTLNLVYYEFIVDGSLQKKIIDLVNAPTYQYFGIDCQTVATTSVAANQLTAIDLSGLQGDITSLAFGNRVQNTLVASANIATVNPLSWQLIQYIDLQLDGISIYQAIQNNDRELLMDQCIFNQAKAACDPVLFTPYNINMTVMNDVKGWNGSLNSNIFKKFVANVQTNVATSSIGVGASMNRWYVFNNGLFSRIK